MITTYKEFIEIESKKDYYIKLKEFVINEYNNYKCYPPYKNIIHAFSITSFNCKNLYIPLSLEKISSIIEYYDYFEKVLNNEFKIYYPETTQYFYDNCEFVDIVTYEHYKLDYEIELICTNGSIMFETYDYKIF